MVVSNPQFLPFFCVLFRWRIKNQLVLKITDLYPDTLEELGILSEKGLVASLWRYVNYFIFLKMDSIIVLGRCMRDRLLKSMPKLSSERIHRVDLWCGKPILNFRQSSNKFITDWDLKNKFVLLYSGNLGRVHDIKSILDCARLLKDFDSIVFLFVGKGYQYSYISEYIQSYDLRNCLIKSFVSYDDLPELLHCADLGIVSLKIGHEGCSVPSKLWSLMGAGVPILSLADPFSEISLVVNDYQCGLCVKPGDVDALKASILSFYNDSSLSDRSGQLAKQACIDHFSIEKAAQSYIDLLFRV